MSREVEFDLLNRMAAEARRGRLNRRDFIHNAVLAGLTVTAASSAWSTRVAAATPKKGGTFPGRPA